MAPAAADNVPVFSVPLNATVLPAPVLLIATLAAVTAWKLAPAEFDTVTVPMSVPTAPVTVMAPPLLKVILEDAPPSTPVIVEAPTVPAPVVFSVKAAPSARAIAPRLWLFAAELIEDVPFTVVFVAVTVPVAVSAVPVSVSVPMSVPIVE